MKRLIAVTKSLLSPFGGEASHAPRWSVIGGVLSMVCNAATIPLLYFILEKAAFAQWATALACLNLWCFPESARNLLVTSGYQDQPSGKNSLTPLFLGVAACFALATMLLQIVGMKQGGRFSELMMSLAPMAILMLAIPFRFRVAECKGLLQANGQWRLHATLVSSMNLLLSVGVVVAAWFTENVVAMAAVYLLVLFGQYLVFERVASIPAPTPQESPVARRQINFAGAMALSLGPLLFSQGDKIGLRFFLSDEKLAEYAFYVSIAGQINIVAALPCIPLAAWSRQSQERRPALLQTAQRWNFRLVVASMLAIGSGFLIFRLFFPGLAVSKLSGTLLLCTVCIYGLISLNGPAYFLLVGQGHYRVVGWVNLLLAALSLGAILLLADMYGITGAILGNLVFGLTVLWGFQASKNVGGPRTSWLIGGVAAVFMFVLGLLVITFSH